MNNFKKLIISSAIISTGLIIPSVKTKDSVYLPINNDSDSTKDVKDSVIVLNHNFDFAYKAFSHYNSGIDSQTVMHFVKVCEYYNLDTTQATFKMFVGQIIVESGSMHYKNGRVNIGSGGHVGIAQISPKSGLAIMTKLVTNDDIKVFRYLSNDSTLTKPTTYSQSIKWLSNEKNNLIFWGYMMNRNLRFGPTENALVRYNAGPGGYQSYVNSGHKVNNHHYIIGIKNKLSKVI